MSLNVLSKVTLQLYGLGPDRVAKLYECIPCDISRKQTVIACTVIRHRRVEKMYLGAKNRSAADVVRMAGAAIVFIIGLILAGGLQAWGSDTQQIGFDDVPFGVDSGAPPFIWMQQGPENTTQRAAIAFSPDGTLVASGNAASNNVEIRSAVDGSLIRVLSAVNNNANVIRFSPDGQYLATGTGQPGQNLSLNLWRVADGTRLVGRIPAFTNGTIGLAFSPDGQYLVACGFHATGYKVYHVPDMTLISTIGNFDPELNYNVRIQDVAVSPDGQLVAVGATRGVYLRSMADGSLVRFIDTNAPYAMPVVSVAFSPGGATLAAGTTAQSTATGTNICSDCSIKLFRVADGELLQTFTDPAVPTYSKIGFSPNGRTIGAGYADFNGTSYSGAAQFWSVTTGRSLRRDARDFWVEDFAYSPSGRTYAFFGADGIVAVAAAPEGDLRKKPRR